MTTWRFITSSLVHHWRIHAAVLLGVAAATAVLSGALLVGDSVRGSLRHLALDRLGKIDELLVVDRFFRSELASELAQQPGFQNHFSTATPAVILPSITAELSSEGETRRAANVLAIGGDESFWDLGDPAARPERAPGPGEIVLNAALAEELGAKRGDEIVLRLAKVAQIPADSPLGRKTDRTTSLAELKVIDIIPVVGLGRFSLQPMQTAPRNAFVAASVLQEALDQRDKANAIFVAGQSLGRSPSAAASAALQSSLHPTLEDFGIALKHVRRTFAKDGQEEVIFDYFSLSSDRMLLDAATERVAERAFASKNAKPVLTFLANDIEKIWASPPRENDTLRPKPIPYSTLTAIDPAPGGPLVDEQGKPLPPLADDEIVLTSWAAEDQQAQVGDRIRVAYFEPETTHGEEQEVSAEFRVKAILPLTKPASAYTRRAAAKYDERPTAANDPDLTPEVQGITDQASIADWDAPFTFDYAKIRPQDDDYWEDHRTTPKAYISLAAGQKLWGSRFGKVTSFRIPAAAGVTEESLREAFLQQLAADDERLGFNFLPLKRQALAASSGTTPFDMLFLALSMFIIAAALLLVWLLYRLGVEQRASEVGLLLALGWTRPKAAWLFVGEGALIAALGAAVGVAAGVGYAWLMLAGLRTWWIGAVTSPFLHLYITPLSLVIGFVCGIVVSVLTIWLSLRGLRRVSVRQLLAGETQVAQSLREVSSQAGARDGGWRVTRFLPPLLILASIGLAILATRLGGEAQAGAFLGSGAAVLAALLMLVSRGLAGTQRSKSGAAPKLTTSMPGLAVRNAGRNVSRSVATIALMASACFLIVAVSSFRLDPTDEGVGGFDLLAESSQPIIDDLNTPAGRKSALADRADVLAGGTVLALRVKTGDDASCQNLYQPSQPRVLGISPAMVAYFDDPQRTHFTWAGSAAQTPEERANPWHVLQRPAGENNADEAVPVVLDKNTAMYSLKLFRGIGEEFTIDYASGPSVKFRVAGLLANSVLQGSLLVGEADFKRLFPTISGYRSFLIQSPPGKSAEVTRVLESKLGDEGFDVEDSRQRLSELLAVQNTYISTFQSLGVLGLVLGTFGLAAVQLRSVFERRKELALMRAVGFRRGKLGQMVLLENLFLLLGGLATGTLAALVTVLPHMWSGGVRVPLVDLLLTLGAVLVVGILIGMIAVRATLQAPLLAALRGE